MEATALDLGAPARGDLSGDGPSPPEPSSTCPAAEPLVRIEGVSKAFGTGPSTVRALDGVSLLVGPDKFFTLLGSSGCGKTTLLRLLAGSERSDAGAIRLGGRDIADDPPHRWPVDTVFQSYAVPAPDGGGQRGLRHLGRPRAAAMLALVRLDGPADRRPAQLSGGQHQRVALARALG